MLVIESLYESLPLAGGGGAIQTEELVATSLTMGLDNIEHLVVGRGTIIISESLNVAFCTCSTKLSMSITV